MIQEAEFANMTFEEQEAYIQAMKSTWDYNNSLEFAETKKAMEIAKRMHEEKEPLDKIVRYTGLTDEQIQALQSS